MPHLVDLAQLMQERDPLFEVFAFNCSELQQIKEMKAGTDINGYLGEQLYIVVFDNDQKYVSDILKNDTVIHFFNSVPAARTTEKQTSV